jgi:hypothetical protein
VHYQQQLGLLEEVDGALPGLAVSGFHFIGLFNGSEIK